MHGYSKLSSRTGNTDKSRSIDFSDFCSFPQTPKPSRNTAPTPAPAPTTHTASSIPEEPGNLQVKKTKTQNSSSPEGEDEGGKGERFGVILGRSGSVSSASSGFQATMKRAFSMRRSSSVSERYCRIHDQYMAIASPLGDEMDGNGIGTRRSIKKKQKGGKIFRACKRLLGL